MTEATLGNIPSAYKTYANASKKIGVEAISLEEWKAKFAEQKAKSVEENKVVVSAEALVKLMELGFEVKSYTPKSGSFKDIEGEYLACDDAKVSTPGFMRLHKDRLLNTRERHVLNIAAIDAVLGQPEA